VKIAFVVHDYRLADVGQTRYVRELARRFSREHEVHIFANRIESDEDQNIHFHHVGAWRMNALTTMLSFAVMSTIRIRGDFDIVHSQGFCGFYGNVFTAHICNRAWHLALRRLEAGVTMRELVFNYFATALEFATYRRARTQVIAVSSRVAQDLKRYYHCRAPMHTIHHGVNLDVFSRERRSALRAKTRQKMRLTEADFTFVFVGNLRKGARKCILALSRLRQGILVCASRTRPEPYLALVEQLGLTNRVRFLDFSEHVEEVYAAADALLLPSPYDAFGMVVTEAMACGLPVVVSREAGASEVITHGANGLLLNEVVDETELAEAMFSLCEDRDWAQQLGCAARETAQHLSWDAVAAMTHRVYIAQVSDDR
jgi:UDP-glucose:(heptosyl)LPS alpha-1,3-glucosyltransferase